MPYSLTEIVSLMGGLLLKNTQRILLQIGCFDETVLNLRPIYENKVIVQNVKSWYSSQINQNL